jgi:hypothetical protein
MITNFKIFEDNNEIFEIDDLVKYKYLYDDIYQIYRIERDKTRLNYQTGYIRNIKTKKPKWEVFNKLRHLTDLEKNMIKYNI